MSSGFNPNAAYQQIGTDTGQVIYLQGGVYFDINGNVVSPLVNVPPGPAGPSYPVATFATLPGASQASGQTYLVSDIGVGGSLWRSNGIRWSPVGGSCILFKCAIPIISCSTGNIGNNGALTAITALPTTYSGGAWVNLPAGAIAAGVPAAQTAYWGIFTTGQAATIYNNIQPASGFPTPPTAGQLVPFVTTGPGAFTGITAATVLLTIPLPAGAMGANGQLRITSSANYTNSAGTKTYGVKLSTLSAPAIAPTTTTNVIKTDIFTNVNSQAINKAAGTSQPGAAQASTYGAIDTSVVQNITLNVTCNTATDNFVLDNALGELLSDGT
jgi:hypothetical protein